MKLHVNGRDLETDASPDTPLLWVLRDHLDLTGTKFGCGMALCGACTVHLDGRPVRSCVTPAVAAEGRKITTIEGLSGDRSHPVQRAWLEIDVRSTSTPVARPASRTTRRAWAWGSTVRFGRPSAGCR